MSATTTAVLDQLDLEWADLTNSRRFADELDEFIRRFPQLEPLGAGAPTSCLSAEDADVVLHGLLTEHAAGSFAAGRAVLQCMVPAMRVIFRRSRGRYGDPADLAQETTAAMWQAITTYDLAQSTRVAMRLKGKTLTYVVGDKAPFTQGRRASRSVTIAEIPTADDLMALLEGPSSEDPAANAFCSILSSTLGPTGEVLDVIAWGVDAGAITHQEATLLTRLYAPDPDLPEYAELTSGRGQYQKRIASELDISHGSLRQRASRAVRRLAEAVQAPL